MKKTLVSILTAGLAFAIIGNTGTVYATEQVTTPSELPQQRSVETKVKFMAPVNESVITVDPRDPENSDRTIDDYNPKHDGEETNFVGPLSLNYVSNFKFNNQVITGETQTYNSTSISPFVQVSDLRGTGEGWNLTAKMSSFKDEKDQESLQGSYITLKNTIATPASDEENIPKPEVALEDILLEKDSAKLIATAKPKKTNEPVVAAEGRGKWIFSWLTESIEATENEKVTLTVPGAVASKGGHKANIVWTLSNGPYRK